MRPPEEARETPEGASGHARAARRGWGGLGPSELGLGAGRTPLNDESLFQIWGSTSGATQLMVRGYSANNGEIRGGGATLSSGCYGVERRVNVIHRQGQDIRTYINGSLKNSFTDSEDVSNYHKYGCYGTLTTGAVTVRWRAARFYKDGQPPP